MADGMGGESFGDVASRLVLQTGAEVAGGLSSWLMNLNNVGMDEVRRRVERYVEAFVQAFEDHPVARDSYQRMGTTWTCAYVMGRDAVVAHVGDSRAALFRDGRLIPLTTDHTVAARMIAMGIAEDEARRYRNVLDNFLGTRKGEVEFDLQHVRMEIGDRLLVCSDGLTDMVPEDEIAAELSRSAPPQETVDALVRAALDHGGKDNVTVLLADLARSSTE